MDIITEARAVVEAKQEQKREQDFVQKIEAMLASRKPYELFEAEAGEQTRIAYSPISRKYICRLTQDDKARFEEIKQEMKDNHFDVVEPISKEEKSFHKAKSCFNDGMTSFDLPDRREAKRDFYMALRR